MTANFGADEGEGEGDETVDVASGTAQLHKHIAERETNEAGVGIPPHGCRPRVTWRHAYSVAPRENADIKRARRRGV